MPEPPVVARALVPLTSIVVGEARRVRDDCGARPTVTVTGGDVAEAYVAAAAFVAAAVKLADLALPGRGVTALERIDAGRGRVLLEGELWNAVSAEPIEPGQAAEIVAVDGLTLKVRPRPAREEEP